MSESRFSTLLRLRLTVGFLGERAQFSWWPTAFYEATSRLFLDPVFTKTPRLAQYHGVLEAARRLHDEHLSVGSYHLFRLPAEVEQDLYSIMLSGAGEEFICQVCQDKDAGLEALKHLAAPTSQAGVGPKLIGNIRELDSKEVLSAIGAAYLTGFMHDTKAYPYLAG